jgi:formylglycine-generating enzyme required for sulfatase activity
LEGLESAYNLPPDFQNCREASKIVSWNRNANGYRLPTEAEWEYAGRAGEQFLFSGSDNIDEVAWYKENSFGGSYPVGDKSPNGWGLYDMSGNVSEWVWDHYERFYSEQEHTDPVYTDPHQAKRMYRGGGWNTPKSLSTLSYRRSGFADLRAENRGFRLVRGL